jgi:hypothetical protein
VSTTGTVSLSQGLNLASIGDRPNAVAASFLRYRYKWLKFTFRSAASSNGLTGATGFNSPAIGNLVMGVVDDVGLSASSADDILNLRVSREVHTFKDASITWSPIDRARWFYVIADSVGDPRFNIPGVFLMSSDVPLQIASTSTPTPVTWNCGVVDLEYCIEYSGATVVVE